jgi:hypothetical protein
MLRVQQPLFVGGLALAAGGVGVSIGLDQFTLGGLGMVFGGWLMLLSVMPNEGRSIIVQRMDARAARQALRHARRLPLVEGAVQPQARAHALQRLAAVHVRAQLRAAAL